MPGKKKRLLGQNVPGLLEELWQASYFISEKSFKEIRDKLNATGCNPPSDTLRMALSRTSFLTRRGSKGNYRYIQKFTPSKISFNQDIFPDELIDALNKDFETELEDLKLNYGKSGTCTAFLLRKILEKLIFLAFAKNGLDNELKDANGDFVGLKAMLNLAVVHKVNGKPFLMRRTLDKIEGIKFLGDTAAHNPLVNVSIKTIQPEMPYIITAYSELAKKL